MPGASQALPAGGLRGGVRSLGAAGGGRWPKTRSELGARSGVGLRPACCAAWLGQELPRGRETERFKVPAEMTPRSCSSPSILSTWTSRLKSRANETPAESLCISVPRSESRLKESRVEPKHISLLHAAFYEPGSGWFAGGVGEERA